MFLWNRKKKERKEEGQKGGRKLGRNNRKEEGRGGGKKGWKEKGREERSKEGREGGKAAKETRREEAPRTQRREREGVEGRRERERITSLGPPMRNNRDLHLMYPVSLRAPCCVKAPTPSVPSAGASGTQC